MSTDPAVDVQWIEHRGYRHAIHLWETSEGTGDLVLLHGAGVASEATWYPMLPEFKSFRRIICPDLRGMGRSHSLDFIDRSVTVDEVVDDVLAILTHYSINQCQMVGYSFGGLIATEIAKKWHREFAILISSTDVTKGLPKIYGWVGKLGVLKLIPSACFQIPKWMANLLFGAKNKRLLSDILDDSDVDFTKWALKALTTWKNETPIINGLKINGTKDVLIPGRKGSHTQFVESGTHFMIVDRADEVSDLVNSFLKNQVAK